MVEGNEAFSRPSPDVIVLQEHPPRMIRTVREGQKAALSMPGPSSLAGSDSDATAAEAARALGARGLRRGIYAQPATRTDIEALHRLFEPHVDAPVASAESAIRVQEASPHSVWSVHSSAGLLGGAAFLPLNTLGLYRLIYGKLDRRDPPLEALAVRLERPAVLYVWALVARGSGLLGLADILRQLDTQRFRGVDVWAQPVTTEGERLAARLGFARISHGDHAFYKLGRSGRPA